MGWTWRAAALAAMDLGCATAATGVGRQASYDQAQAAMDRQDWPAAAAGFLPLLPTDPHKPLGRSDAVIAVRLGETLMHLRRNDEAEPWLARAVGDLPKDPALIGVWLDVGRTARSIYAYDLAARADRTALALADAAGDGKSASLARLDLAQAVMTEDPAAAAAALDPILATDAGGTERIVRAQVEALRARAAIIAGDRPTAQRWIRAALDHSGGLTDTNVSVVQAEIRADAAIIARLGGDDENARRYLAYTGAGHLKNMDWLGHHAGDLPTCDTDGGIRPQDSVVVRFLIREDGDVAAAAPVYTSRPGPMAAVFADAVSRWRWNPDELKGVDDFLRGTVRLELRCRSRPAPLALAAPFVVQTAEWLVATHHLDPASLPAIVQGGTDRTAAVLSSDPLSGALFGRGSRVDGRPYTYTEARRTLEAEGAPASAHAVLALAQARDSVPADGIRETQAGLGSALSRLAPPVLDRFPQDKASAWLALEWALAWEGAGRFPEAQPLVARVLATPASVLPVDDPIRQVATLHAALIATRMGKTAGPVAAARVDPQQCALFDTRPIPASVSVSSKNFPADALRWGFEGHVEEDFDIGDDGRVAGVRTVIAYPPFIFGPGTEKAVAGFRYVPPSIGGQAVGCDSQTLRFNYHLPNR